MVVNEEPDMGARSKPHVLLDRQQVLDAAIAVADRAGIAALTIRKLAEEFAAAPMSPYHQVPAETRRIPGGVARPRGPLLEWPDA